MHPKWIRGRQAAKWTILVLCIAGFSSAAGQWHHIPSSSAGDKKSEQALTIGKKLFVERCGRCHDERGDKPLPEGPPLNERELSTDQIAQAVRGRFKDKTDDERAAVIAYIESFLKTKPRPERDE